MNAVMFKLPIHTLIITGAVDVWHVQRHFYLNEIFITVPVVIQLFYKLRIRLRNEVLEQQRIPDKIKQVNRKQKYGK